MTKIDRSLLVASMSSAFAAASDCATGYKDFVSKMSTCVNKMSGDEIADYIRKGSPTIRAWLVTTRSHRTACGTGSSRR